MRKTICLPCFLLVIVLIATERVAATDMTVFGLTIGKKFDVGECEKVSPKLPNHYKYNDSNVCYERFRDFKGTEMVLSSVPLANASVLIKFPVKQWPEIASADGITASLIDGNLESVTITTNGFGRAESVLTALIDKYGKPTIVIREKAQNAFGASYEYPNASWKFENLNVTFIGVLYKIDEGLIRIESDKAKDRREKFESERDKIKRKL